MLHLTGRKSYLSMLPPVLLTKIGGSVALGLWAGYNVALVHLSHSHPNDANSSRSGPPTWLEYALSSTAFSGAVSGLFLFSYTFSKGSDKHPYLLYLALCAPLIGVLQFFGAQSLISQYTVTPDSPRNSSDDEHSELTGSIYGTIELDSPPRELRNAANIVEEPERKATIYYKVVAGLCLGLFGLATVGLAGDTSF